MNNIIYTFSLFFLLFGCTKEESNPVYITAFPTEERITYTPVQIEQTKPWCVLFRDSLMVVANSIRAMGSKAIQVYHKETLNHLADYGIIGRGPGEYLVPKPLIQNGSDAHSFYIYDKRLATIFDVDLNKILDGVPPVKNKIKIAPDDLDWGLFSHSYFVTSNRILGENSFYGLDKKFFSIDRVNDQLKWIKTDFYKKTPAMERFLKSVKDEENPFEQGNYAQSLLTYSIPNKKIVGAMNRFNRIDIMDFDFKIQKTIIYGKKLLSSTDGGQQFLFPMSLPNGFLVPYHLGINIHSNNKGKQDFEIHQYDHQGNPLRKFIIDKPVTSLYHDKQSNTVYAVLDHYYTETPLVKLNINPNYLD